MPGPAHESAACSCGQVVFDVSARRVGQVLTCPHCSRRYRYLGSEAIAPLEPGEEEDQENGADAEAEDGRETEQRQERIKETVRLEAVSEKDERPRERGTGEPDRLSDRMKAHSAKRKRQQAAVEAGKSERIGEAPRGTTKRAQPREIPGSTRRMIAYIIICNGTALVLLHLLFPPYPDGRRGTPWDDVVIPRFSVPWPELVTLLIGHVVAFVLWARYIYGLQVRMKAEQAAELGAGRQAVGKESAPKTAEAGRKDDRARRETRGTSDGENSKAARVRVDKDRDREEDEELAEDAEEDDSDDAEDDSRRIPDKRSAREPGGAGKRKRDE